MKEKPKAKNHSPRDSPKYKAVEDTPSYEKEGTHSQCSGNCETCPFRDTCKKRNPDTKPFNLSEERKKLFNPVFIPLNGYDKKTLEEVKKFVEMQDKEFIKRLKDTLKITKESIGLADRYDRRTIVNICAFFEGEIDKLSGKELI